MKITVNVRIDQEPSDSPYTGGYGNVQFAEDASLANANFETVSKVFTRVHELLDTLKSEHRANKR